jgi:hypothetical protein
MADYRLVLYRIVRLDSLRVDPAFPRSVQLAPGALVNKQCRPGASTEPSKVPSLHRTSYDGWPCG